MPSNNNAAIEPATVRALDTPWEDTGRDALQRRAVVLQAERQYGLTVTDHAVMPIATFGDLLQYVDRQSTV